jgi:hypothetical protein
VYERMLGLYPDRRGTGKVRSAECHERRPAGADRLLSEHFSMEIGNERTRVPVA